MADRRGDAPGAHVQGRDAELRRAVGGRARVRLGARGARAGARRARRRSTSTSASRPSTAILGTLRRRRGVRPGQPGAAAQAGRLHPRRLQRARRSSPPRSATRCCAPSSPRTSVEHVIVLGAEAPDGRARLGRGPRRRRDSPTPGVDRPRHGGDPLHLRQHGQAEGRGALAPQPARRRRERQPVPREPRRRRHPRRAAAQLRRRVQPADDRLHRRRARRAGQLPAAAATSSGSVREAPGHRAHVRAAAVDPARRPAVAGGGDPQPALLRQHRRADAARDARPAPRDLPRGQAVPDVRAHRGVPVDVPRPRRGRPPAGLDRQGDPERRDPGRPRGRHAVRARRGGRARPPRRARRARLLERRRADRRALPAGARPRRPASRRTEIAVWSGDAGDRRGGLPLLRRPQGRDDQDLRLPGQPDRDRGGRLRAPGWCGDAVALGVDDDRLGQHIVLVGEPRERPRAAAGDACSAELRQQLPLYMVPEATSSSAPSCRARPTASSTATSCARSWRRHERRDRRHAHAAQPASRSAASRVERLGRAGRRARRSSPTTAR